MSKRTGPRSADTVTEAEVRQAPDPARDALDQLPPGFEHPRGTLAIVATFGLLFALAWLATYLAFLERGAPHLHP